MSIHNRIHAVLAALTGVVPTGLLAVVAAIATIAPAPVAEASNGQCVWEGGSGAAASCRVEDCIGRGGNARCSVGAPAAYTAGNDGGLLPHKWFYGADNGYSNAPIWAMWCQAGGGVWVPNVNPYCDGGTFQSANEEGRILEIAQNFVDIQAGGCAPTHVVSDSGWTQASESLGIPTSSNRTRSYVSSNSSCSNSSITITFTRLRGAQCPANYTARSAAAGQECWRPAECDQTCTGNPVSMVTGTKFEQEEDYTPDAATGLELVRYYASSGYFWPEYLGVTATGDPTSGDYWRHSYERRFIAVSGNSHVMAVVQRPQGSLQVFDTAGQQVGKVNGTLGGGARLQAVGGGFDLTMPSADVEHYNSAGQLTSITTRTGQVTTLTYSAGRLATVTGPFGHALAFDYEGPYLETVTLPGGGSITYGYDTGGRLSSVTYPDGKSRHYHYSAGPHSYSLTGIVDESNATFGTYAYDAKGRVTSESHAGGVEPYTFSYGTSAGQPTTVTDPLGAVTQHGFVSAGGLYRPGTAAQACLRCGSAASITYDSNGNPASRTDFNGHQTIYTFDATRNLETSRTEAVGTPNARTITTQWHATFRLPIEITEPGRRTNLTYDGDGNVLTQTLTDTGTNASRTWTFTYTGLGQLLTIDGPRTDVTDVTTLTYYACTSGAQCGQLHTVTDAANNVTTYGSYNAHGLPLSINDPNGTLITLAYDDRQRLASRTVAGETTGFEYWATGLLKKVTQPDGSFVSYGYDAAHRLTSVTDTLGNTLTYTLNGAGQRLTEEVRDSANVLTYRRTRVYNNLGRLIEESGTAGQITSFGYDADGNITEIEDPLGRVTSQIYDELDRLDTLVDPALQFTEFSYDGQDNLLSVVDPRTLTTSYGYNGFGEQVSQSSPDTGASSSPRDAAGNLATATDARNKTAGYTHDALSRVSEIEHADETVGFGYDAGANGKGRLTSMTDASGSTSWSYDAVGRVTERSQMTGSVALEVGYGYDSYGRLSSLTTPSGQTLTYEYTDGLLSGLKVNGAWILNQVAYQPFGPLKSWNWGNGTATTRSYDTDGQLTQVSSAGSSTYTFHPDGAIATRADDFTVSLPSTAGTTSFAVSSTSNRLQSAAGQISRSYGYDAAGNTTSDGAHAFTYNDTGRMKTATSASVTTTYSYNGLGERVKKSNSSSTTYFAYDEAGHLLGEYDAEGDLIQETVWLGDIPVAVLKPSVGSGISVFYIHADHLNTPRRITRPSDNVIVWRWDSDPFGATAANEDPDGDTVAFAYHPRFPGQYFDAETGLHYNYFRDYDAVTGRYIQSDPIGLAGGLNTYLYVGGNPLTFTDPLGLQRPPRVGQLPQAIRNELATARAPNLIRQIQLYNPSYQYSTIGPIGIGYTAADVRNLERELAFFQQQNFCLSPVAARTAQYSPNFIVSPGGTVFPVPAGATGPTPVINPAGQWRGDAFTGGRGGGNQQVDTLRIMDPTPPRGSSPGYPRGNISYQNDRGQHVDPYSGRTLPHAQSHFPID